MRKYLILAGLIFASVFALLSCNDPVFYTVYTAVEPKDPRITGAPTNFAVFKDVMYVASGSNIHKYYLNAETGIAGWDSATLQPGGRVTKIASTENYLYALCFSDDSSSSLKRFDGAVWEDVNGDTGDYEIQNIYPVNNHLFLRSHSSKKFRIMYIDESVSLTAVNILKLTMDGEEITEETAEIIGVVHNALNFYICTRVDGIYKTSNPADGAASIDRETDDKEYVKSKGVEFTGIINLETDDNLIALMTRAGNLYLVNDGAVNELSQAAAVIDKSAVTSHITLGGRQSTGALAIYTDKDDPSKRLLLAGRQDKLNYTNDPGYTNGYLELEIDSSGIVTDKTETNDDGTVKITIKNFIEPGKNAFSTVNDNDRYNSTIGKEPINYLFQVPAEIDSDMILFASTQQNGVRSYRNRSDGWQWNAEE